MGNEVPAMLVQLDLCLQPGPLDHRGIHFSQLGFAGNSISVFHYASLPQLRITEIVQELTLCGNCSGGLRRVDELRWCVIPLPADMQGGECARFRRSSYKHVNHPAIRSR